MKITLNIGLNNNPYNHTELKNLLNNVGTILNSRQIDSTYNGVLEPTSVIIVDLDVLNTKILREWVKDLCNITTQECIAVKNDDGFQELIYNRGFKGEKHTFSTDFFKEIV